MPEPSGNPGLYHDANYGTYPYTSSAQTLMPPTVNTGYPSNGYYMNRTSPHSSSDSGYGTSTKTPSVASPSPQPSYPTQSYPVQNSRFRNYSTQSYFPSRQLSQHATTPYSDVRSPSVEVVVQTAPVSASKHKKEGRLNSPSPSCPSEYPCLYPHCDHISFHAHDLKRHMNVHFSPDEDSLLDCKYEWCGRTGAYGFKREDHRKEHYRKVHMKETEYPKPGNGGRSERVLKARPPSPAASKTHTPILSENKIPPKRCETTNWESAAKKQVIPSPRTETPELSTATLAEPGILQPLQIYETLPDQQGTESRLPVPDADVVKSEALEANVIAPMDWLAIKSDNMELGLKKLNSMSPSLLDESMPSLDEGNVHQAHEYAMLHDPEARVERERTRPVEAALDESRSFVALMSQPSTEDRLAAIVSQVLETLVTNEAGQYCASLKLQWDILGFIEDQFRDNDSPNTALGRVITISGSARHAQAATCSDYIRQKWPTHGSTILDALQDALNKPVHTSQSKLVVRNEDGDCGSDVATCSAELVFNITQHFTFLSVKSGYSNIIVDIVEQLIWMAAALRISGNGGIQYCEPRLESFPVRKSRGMERLFIDVKFEMRSPGEADRSCWFPLFKNPVIAYGFPTAHRSDHEVGLEIPLDMMAALGGARHAVDFEGGLVLKGHSAMFVPLKRYPQSVQWHLIRRSDEHRILYRELSNECPNRAMLEEVDHEALLNTRAFLGWWPSSETHLGTADAAYNSIDWSSAGEAKRTARFSGASIGFQTMVTGQLSFAPGAKDGRLHFSQKGPFQKTVQSAQKTPVLLYDPTDRRAWCVPGLELMLHIVQTRHHLSPYNINGEKVELTPVKPENGRGAAIEAVTANQLRRLYARNIASEKNHYFQDEILDIWSRMERLMEEKDLLEASPGLALHGTMQSKLHGWEYMSLVNEKSYKRKEAKVAKSSGGWVDLFNDVDALILFATGFEDIIKPVSNLSNLCRPWRTLPKGKDYLAVGVPILEMLYSEAGSRLSRKHLSTGRHQWHRGSVLFEHCSNTTSCRCECDRTQQIYPESSFKTFGHVKPPGSLEENGCVIFGQAYHPFKPPQTTARSQNTIRSLVNLSTRSSRSTMQSSANNKLSIPPSPPPSVSPESGETGDDATWSRERPPSPVSFTDDIAQEKDVVRRRMLPHNQIPNFEKRRRLDNGGDGDDCAKNPLEYHPMLGHDEISNGQNLGCTAIAGGSTAGCIPLDGRKAIRHKAKIADFNYRQSFSLATCSTMGLDPPGSPKDRKVDFTKKANVKV